MLPLVAAGILLYFALTGSSTLAMLLVGAGFVWIVGLSLRLANQLQSGTGGHAEWVRDVTTRTAAIRSPGWLLSLLLVVSGVLVRWVSGLCSRPPLRAETSALDSQLRRATTTRVPPRPTAVETSVATTAKGKRREPNNRLSAVSPGRSGALLPVSL